MVAQGFLRLLGPERKGTIINVTSYSAINGDAAESAYGLSKLVNLQFSSSLAAEYPNVVSVSMHPGMVESPMTLDGFRKFSKDTPELAGGAAVWLSTDKAAFMNGRFLDVNWDVEELEARKEEIVTADKLKLMMRGT
jgi:NAD(P)-dependent dehydrogenase (short-subunit alcohol dehydrogenase family)